MILPQHPFLSSAAAASDQQLFQQIRMRILRLCFLLTPLLPVFLLAFLLLQSISWSTPSPNSTHHPPACSSETELLVLVESLPLNSDLRRMIRSSWGNTNTLGSRLRLVFLLSGDRGDVNRDHQEEEEDEIVFANPGSFPTLAGLAWSVPACPKVPQKRKILSVF